MSLSLRSQDRQEKKLGQAIGYGSLDSQLATPSRPRLLEPDFWHLILIFGLHTLVQFTLARTLLSKLPHEALAKMSLPTSFSAAKSISETLKSLMETNCTQIYVLLMSCLFYFQLWHIPLTWVFALSCGACMPNFFVALGAVHSVNLLGVCCAWYYSRTFLRRLITGSQRLTSLLSNLQNEISKIESSQVQLAMISLRMLPGSPNSLYNLLYPHVNGISLKQSLCSVLLGQLPHNLCVVKAGQMICKINSRSEIIDLQTTLELLIVALAFMLPLIYKKYKDANKQEREGDVSLSTIASSSYYSLNYGSDEEALIDYAAIEMTTKE